MSWKRPESVQYPSVWLEFEARDCDSDNLVKYRVQDLPENHFQNAIDHMIRCFLHDEPLCIAKDILNDKQSVDEIVSYWKTFMEQKMVLACYKDGCDEIVGLNMTGVASPDDEHIELKGHAFKTMFDADAYMFKKSGVYDLYNVKKYITAFGLSVDPKYRRRGIAAQILKARAPLGKAVGIPITITVFTAIKSQKAATNVGYTTDCEFLYSDLKKLGYVYPGLEEVSAKVMSLKCE